MKSKTIMRIAAVVTALGLAGCGSSDSTGSSTPSSATTSSSATSSSATSSSAGPTSSAPPLTTAPPTPAPSGGQTIADYLASNGITETPARAGVDNAPQIELPAIEGWEPAIDVPGDPFWAVTLMQAAAPEDPALIQATLTKLSGDVPAQAIFEHSLGELEGLPGYQSMGSGGAQSQLGGLPASQDGALFDDNGVQKLVAQKVVVIDTPRGTYLLRVRAIGSEADAPSLISATATVDDNAVITP